MAIYEFLCQDCGYNDDLIRKMDEPTLLTCPKCHKKSFHKQVSAPSFSLSGSGWYETDFKNKKAPITKEKKENKKND
jgi:putative FmdB family regulatory protein